MKLKTQIVMKLINSNDNQTKKNSNDNQTKKNSNGDRTQLKL